MGRKNEQNDKPEFGKDMKIVYALGFFDGVHLGHQALLTQCVKLSEQLNFLPGAVTFDIHPQSIIAGQAPVMLNTPSDRVRLLQSYGIQKVQTLRFDEQTMTMPWQDFLRYLTGQLDAGGLVCGDDFRFGANGEGTAALLQETCEKMGIPCVVVPEQTVDGIRVSSTHIRQLIAQGRMDEAVRFLGHPHMLTGTVVSGRKLGRTIGVPTANLWMPEGVAVPAFGVYACVAQVDGKTLLAVTNVGTRPTVGGHRITVEPWLLDFTGDLYGKTLTLEFHHFLRPEQKFDSLEALQAQIQIDAENTRAYFQNR